MSEVMTGTDPFGLVTCPRCEGDGSCPECDGAGRTFLFFTCPSCKGRGYCRRCRSHGEVIAGSTNRSGSGGRRRAFRRFGRVREDAGSSAER